MLVLFDDQVDCVHAIYDYLRTETGNPCAVVPTGGGKTAILATICKDAVTIWDGRVLIVTHVKELIEQSAAELQSVCPDLAIGVYSAGLKRRDTGAPVIVAGIQSAHDKAQQLGRFDLIIIDECHLIPAKGYGQYRRLIHGLIEINPDIRVVGLTATPYRLDSGPICSPDGILNHVCYEIGVKELVKKGRLCPLIGKAAVAEIDTAAIDIVRGEYDDAQLNAAYMAGDEVDRACREIVERAADRHSVLVFCQGVEHAGRVAAALRQLDFGQVVHEVYGATPADDRKRFVDEFKAGAAKYLVNVNVLTTGFNARNVDCVCLLRSTVSPGLFYQCVGRGFRVHESKKNALVLDFGQNIQRHGPVDAIVPKKAGDKKADGDKGRVCPVCRTVSAMGTKACPDCGHMWPVREREISHSGAASADDPLSGKPKIEKYAVQAVKYKVHHKKGGTADTPKTMRVVYQVALNLSFSEWVCVEHSGFALDKAQAWWAARCGFMMPTNAVAAVTVAQHGLLVNVTEIEVRTTPGDPFPEVVRHAVGARPILPPACGCGAINRNIIVRDTGSDFPHPGKVVCGECGAYKWWASQDQVDHYGFFHDPLTMRAGGLLDYDLPEVAPDGGQLQLADGGDESPDNCPF